MSASWGLLFNWRGARGGLFEKPKRIPQLINAAALVRVCGLVPQVPRRTRPTHFRIIQPIADDMLDGPHHFGASPQRCQ
jgi:hypothetical protein